MAYKRGKKEPGTPFELAEELLKTLPLGIVARSELGRLTGGLLNPKTMANWDSQGRGPKRKIIGPRGKVAYYTEDLIELLKAQCRIENKMPQN